MSILIRIKLKIKCKIGWHDPMVYGYTKVTLIQGGAQKEEMYYTCLYCPYGFWDYIIDPPETDMDNLTEYKLGKLKEKHLRRKLQNE